MMIKKQDIDHLCSCQKPCSQNRYTVFYTTVTEVYSEWNSAGLGMPNFESLEWNLYEQMVKGLYNLLYKMRPPVYPQTSYIHRSRW